MPGRAVTNWAGRNVLGSLWWLLDWLHVLSDHLNVEWQDLAIGRSHRTWRRYQLPGPWHLKKKKRCGNERGSPQSPQATSSPSISKIKDNTAQYTKASECHCETKQPLQLYTIQFLSVCLRIDRQVRGLYTLACASANEGVILTQPFITWNKKTYKG